MRLQHIVSKHGYEFLMDKGYLIGDGRRIIRSFKDAYDWLVIKMDERINRPLHSGKYPVWAWYQWGGKRNVDLRSYRHVCAPGNYFLITFDIDERDVVLTDFDRWHCVLNRCFLCESENEYDEFYKNKRELKNIEFGSWDMINDTNTIVCKIRNSWERIFNIETPWYCVNSIEIQATFWKLTKDMIVNVRPFKGYSKYE